MRNVGDINNESIALRNAILKLGSGVALAFTRSPLETALTAIDIDTISGGRMVLGLGTSLRWWNESWHGVTYGKPISHLREVIRIVREIIVGAHSGKLGKIEGEYYKLDLTGFRTLAPPVRDQIPIYVPAVFEGGVRLAGEIADGLAGHPIWSAQWIDNQLRRTLEESLHKAGRKRSDFDLNIWAFVAIDDDRKRAIDDARRADFSLTRRGFGLRVEIVREFVFIEGAFEICLHRQREKAPNGWWVDLISIAFNLNPALFSHARFC